MNPGCHLKKFGHLQEPVEGLSFFEKTRRCSKIKPISHVCAKFQVNRLNRLACRARTEGSNGETEKRINGETGHTTAGYKIIKYCYAMLNNDLKWKGFVNCEFILKIFTWHQKVGAYFPCLCKISGQSVEPFGL